MFKNPNNQNSNKLNNSKNFNSSPSTTFTNNVYDKSISNLDLKKKYLAMLKEKHKHNSRNYKIENNIIDKDNNLENEIEQLLLENDSFTNDNIEKSSYNSFLN